MEELYERQTCEIHPSDNVGLPQAITAKDEHRVCDEIWARAPQGEFDELFSGT
jgi:hypothetical protein